MTLGELATTLSCSLRSKMAAELDCNGDGLRMSSHQCQEPPDEELRYLLSPSPGSRIEFPMFSVVAV